jgi:nicotinamide mononucleotide transporter
MSPVEVTAVAFGLACVILTIRQNIWAWPAGLIQVLLYVWIFKQTRLYSDMVLHIIYVPMQLYGWYHWLHGKGRDPALEQIPITRMSVVGLIGWATAAAAAIVIDGYVMRRYFDAALPYWDAAIAVLSLVAQYLLARKVLENWAIWIAVDFIAIGVYWNKGIKLTAGLYAVFLVLATIGLIAWLRAYRRQTSQTGNTPGSQLKATTRIPTTTMTS